MNESTIRLYFYTRTLKALCVATAENRYARYFFYLSLPALAAWAWS